MDGPPSEAMTRRVAAGPLTQTCDAPSEPSAVARIRRALFDEPSRAGRIGRYYVLDEVGRGGLGVVYSAFDPQLNRRVALKLVASGGADAEARLLREARALARLTHPNVVAVHDAGTYEAGVFIAMELVSGCTLSAWVRRERPDWEQTRDVLLAAGRGLQAAHAAGVIHRDFKPSNILVGDDGRVRVVDFGLARSFVAPEVPVGTPGADPDGVDAHASTTQTGALMGTPVYMAPEQFAGEVSSGTDIWAFCVTAYEVLYGARPFDAPSLAELIAFTRSGRVPEPSDTRSVPAWMHRALLRGLRVDPADRYPSMRELLAAIEDPVPRRPRRWLVPLGIGVLVLAATLSSATAWWATRAPVANPQIIAALERDARDAAHRGAFVYPSLDDPSRPTAYASVVRLEATASEDGDAASERAGALRAEFADTLTELGDRYADIDGGLGFASDFYAAALLFDPERHELRARTAVTLGQLAELRRRAEAGEFSEAELRGAAVLGALGDADPDVRTQKLEHLANDAGGVPAGVRTDVVRLLGKTGRAPGEPPPRAPSAAPPKPSSPAPPPTTAPSSGASAPPVEPSPRDPSTSRAVAREGQALLERGELDLAETSFHRALALDERNDAALGGLSEVYFNRAAHQKALGFARRAVKLAPRRAAYRMQLGDAYFKVLRYEDAEREYEAARDLGHPGAATALARIHSRLGGASPSSR